MLHRIFGAVFLAFLFGSQAHSAPNKLTFEIESTYEMNDLDSRMEARQILNRDLARSAAQRVQDYVEKGLFFGDGTVISESDLPKLAMMAYYTAKVEVLNERFSVNSSGRQTLTVLASVEIDSGLVARRMAIIGSSHPLSLMVDTVEKDNKRIDEALEELTLEMAAGATNERLMEIVAQRKSLLLDLGANRDALVSAINQASIEVEAEDSMQQMAMFRYHLATGFTNKIRDTKPYIFRADRYKSKEGKGLDYVIKARYKVDTDKLISDLARQFEVSSYTEHGLNGNIKTTVFPDRTGSILKKKMFEDLAKYDVFLVAKIGDREQRVQVAGISPKAEMDKFQPRSNKVEQNLDFYVFNYIMHGTYSGEALFEFNFESVPARFGEDDIKLRLEIIDNGDFNE